MTTMEKKRNCSPCTATPRLWKWKMFWILETTYVRYVGLTKLFNAERKTFNHVEILFNVISSFKDLFFWVHVYVELKLILFNQRRDAMEKFNIFRECFSTSVPYMVSTFILAIQCTALAILCLCPPISLQRYNVPCRPDNYWQCEITVYQKKIWKLF